MEDITIDFFVNINTHLMKKTNVNIILILKSDSPSTLWNKSFLCMPKFFMI